VSAVWVRLLYERHDGSEESAMTKDGTTAPAQDYHAAYQAKLAEAIRALTDAARLPRPRLRRTEDGHWVEDTLASPDQTDWAEFVTLALAGAAANLGGIDAILNGRSGSWEAEGVRQLLFSTVGADEAQLWEHRTEPLEITLYVDELVADRAYEAVEQYDAAEAEINRRVDVAAADSGIDKERYLWAYDRTESGDFVPRDPQAPAWSWDAWRAGLAPGNPADLNAALEESLRAGVGLFSGRHDVTSAYIAKTPELGAEYDRLVAEHEDRVASIAKLEEQLQLQRMREWTAYGEALKARIETMAAAAPGLTVPVNVTVDVETYRMDATRREGFWNSLESRLVDAAVLDTPTPADLPGTPLERLEQQ
jgi:hypothetical protein